MHFKSHLETVGICPPKSARFKICTYELGDCSLTEAEWNQVNDALQREASSLRSIAEQISEDSNDHKEALT